MNNTNSSEKDGRQFWVDFVAGGLYSQYWLSQFIEIGSRYQASEFDEMMYEMTETLQKLGYATDMSTVLKQFDPARQMEKGFWAGRYALFDADGNAYELTIDDDNVEISAGEATLKDGTFKNGVLRAGNEKCVFELTMEMPLSEEAIDADNFDLQMATRASQPKCKGTVTLIDGGGSKTLRVFGKRGCWSRDGVNRDEDGDAPGFWAGTYQVAFTGQDPWEWSADPFKFCVDDNRVLLDGNKPQVRFGVAEGKSVDFVDNVLRCQLGADPENEIIARFELAPGRRVRFTGAVRNGDSVRPVTGFLSERALQKRQVQASVPAAAHAQGLRLSRQRAPLAATLNAGETETWPDLPHYTIDLDKVLSATSPQTEWELPFAVEANTYALVLSLVHVIPESTTPTISWVITHSDSEPLIYAVEVDPQDNRKARFRCTPGETQHAGFRKIDIRLTARWSSGHYFDKTLNITLPIDSRENITISNPDLPPVTLGKDYQVKLVATGGTKPLTWKQLDNSDPKRPSLPSGLSFDAATQVLSGTIASTSHSLVGQVFSLALEVSCNPNIVLMDPTRETLYLTVQEPEMQGKVVTDWISWVVALGGGLLALGTFLYGRYRRFGGPAWGPKKEKEWDKMQVEMQEFRGGFSRSLEGFSSKLETLMRQQVEAQRETLERLDRDRTQALEAAKRADEQSRDLQKQIEQLREDHKRASEEMRRSLEGQIETAKKKLEQELATQKRLEEEARKAREESRKGTSEIERLERQRHRPE